MYILLTVPLTVGYKINSPHAVVSDVTGTNQLLITVDFSEKKNTIVEHYDIFLSYYWSVYM